MIYKKKVEYANVPSKMNFPETWPRSYRPRVIPLSIRDLAL